MSRSKTDGDVVPTKSLTLNLDLHGFELVESAPAEATADFVCAMDGSYDLEIETSDDQDWRVELDVHPAGHMKVGDIFLDGELVTRDGDGADLEDLDEWLQYIVRHVTTEFAGGL